MFVSCFLCVVRAVAPETRWSLTQRCAALRVSNGVWSGNINNKAAKEQLGFYTTQSNVKHCKAL